MFAYWFICLNAAYFLPSLWYANHWFIVRHSTGNKSRNYWNGVSRSSGWLPIVNHQHIHFHLLYILGHYPAICRERSFHTQVLPTSRIRHTDTRIRWCDSSLPAIDLYRVRHTQVEEEEEEGIMPINIMFRFFNFFPLFMLLRFRFQFWKKTVNEEIGFPSMFLHVYMEHVCQIH